MKTLKIKRFTERNNDIMTNQSDKDETDYLVLQCKFRKLLLRTNSGFNFTVMLDCKAPEQFKIGEYVSVDVKGFEVVQTRESTEASRQQAAVFILAPQISPQVTARPHGILSRPQSPMFNKVPQL